MTHPNLNDLSSQADLDYEIGQSKQCLENHGFNPTIFAYPNGEGSDNPKVVNTVAKYYDLARTAKSSAPTFLQCDGNVDNNEQQKTYCGTYLSDGELTPANRYSINSTLTMTALLMVMVLVVLVLVIASLTLVKDVSEIRYSCK
jgi:hypothetical protein